MPRSSGGKRPSTTAMTTATSAGYAMVQPRRSAMVSSASLQRVGAMKAPIGAPETWIKDAYGYYEVVPEIAFIMNLMADTLASCEMVPVERDDSVAKGGWRETADRRVSRVWDAFVPVVGGKKELMRKAALQSQIGGECYLVGTAQPADGAVRGGRTWEFCSPIEIRVESTGVMKRDFGGYAGQQPVTLPPETDISRFWRSDPKYAFRSDCAMKHLLTIAQEVVLLTQVVDAVAKSRLPAGLLIVADELSFGPDEETEEDSDDTDQKDPLSTDLIDQLIAPLEDRASAASLVPLLLRVPHEFVADGVKLIDLSRELDSLFLDLRNEAIHRIAIGLDVPPEMLEGKSNLSHWGSYNVDAQFVDKHVKPLGEALCEFLTQAYLIPMLINHEDMTEEEALNFRLRFDASKITSKTDASGNARAAYDRKEISRATFLRENGFDESDAPDHEERKERDLDALMEAEPVVFGPQIIFYKYPELQGKIDLSIAGFDENGVATDPDPGNPAAAPERKNDTGPTSRPVRDQDSGQGEPARRGPAGSRLEESLIDKITASADDALDQAVEEIGRSIQAALRGIESPLANKVRGLTPKQVPFSLSGREAKTVGLDQIVAECLRPFANETAAGLREHFITDGYDPSDAERKAAVVMEDFMRSYKAFAVATLISAAEVLPVPRTMAFQSFKVHTLNAPPTKVRIDPISSN
jgi:hypothetical protein